MDPTPFFINNHHHCEKMKLSYSLVLLAGALDASWAFQAPLVPTTQAASHSHTPLASSTADDFANFAASLEEETKDDFITKNKSWQEDLEELLEPKTPLARRQILLSDLMSANQDIQASVQAALRDRKVCLD